MKILEICCGPNKVEEAIGVDIRAWPGVDVIADLEKDWPFKTQSFDQVVARDAIEHLHGQIHTMNEIYRILKKEGQAQIIVPSTDGRGAFQDPTHVSFWNYNSFFYYSVDHPNYLALCWGYGFIGAFKILEITHRQGPAQTVWVQAILLKPQKF